MGENRWIFAVARRCLRYGARMGLYFLLLDLGIALALGAIGASLEFLWSPSFSHVADLFSIRFLRFGIPFSIGGWFIGAIGGVVAGFYSPPRDVDGAFFKSVFKSGRQWLFYGFLVGGVTSITLTALWVAFFGGGGVGFLPTFALAWLGEMEGIWKGIRLARAAVAVAVNLERGDG